MTEVEDPGARAPQPVHLLGANIPADQGLSSLGLLMQLTGSVFAAIIAFFGFQTLFLFSRADSTMVILLLTTLGVVRSLMHRAAGTGLLYGPRPLAGVRRYVIVGLAHSVLFAAVMITQDLAPTRIAVCFGLALAVWPLMLGALVRLPWMARFEEEVPVSEDKGFEGAAVLMTVMSAAGVIVSGIMLNGFISSRGAMEGMGALVALTMLLLLGRSIVHLVAGVTGLRNVPLDNAVERVAQYSNLGVVSAFVAAGVLLIVAMGAGFGFAGLLLVAVSGWLLAIWPMALRRFFAERQFASMLAGDDAPIHRRAPDAGLTSLGWLLIAMGAMNVSVAIIAAGSSFGDEAVLQTFRPLLAMGSWRTAVIGALQLYAGFELVRMTKNHRLIATATAALIAGLELAMWSPGWQALAGLELGAGVYNTSFFASLLGPLGLALATVILVNRKIAPMAHATVRQRPMS